MWDAITGEITGQFTGYNVSVDPIAYGQCITSPPLDPTDHAEQVRTEDVEKVDLINKFPIDRYSWMREESELMTTVWIAGKHETSLDLKDFVHGSNWSTVQFHSKSSRDHLYATYSIFIQIARLPVQVI
jgi:hypothetical protein